MIDNNINNEIEELNNILNNVKFKLNKTNLYFCLLKSCYIFLMVVTISVISEALFNFSASARTTIFFLFAIAFAFIIFTIAKQLLKMFGFVKSYTKHDIAIIIGNHFSSIKDNLTNSLQLAERLNSNDNYSKELVCAYIKNVISNIKKLNLTECVSTKHLKSQRNIVIGTAFFCLILFATLNQTIINSFNRLIYYSTEFLPPQKYIINVFPGNKEIIKGENITISASITTVSEFNTNRPKHLTFYFLQEGQNNYEENKVKPDTNEMFRVQLNHIKNTTKYFAVYDSEKSQEYKLTVNDFPLIKSFKVKLDYPAYTKMPNKLLDDFIGDINAIKGTKITLNGSSNKDLKNAYLFFGDKSKIPLKINRNYFTTNFTIFKDNSYCVIITDNNNLSNKEPISYNLKIIPDANPTIEIVHPEKYADIADNQKIKILLKATDDFGFTELKIGHRLIKSRYEAQQNDYSFTKIKIDNLLATNHFEEWVEWNFKKLNLMPEDVLEYFAEIYDNDNISGPKSGKSDLHILRLPSLEEVFADIDKEQDKSIEDLKNTLEEAKKLNEKIESLNRDFKKNKEPDWQTQNKIEEITKQYNELENKINKNLEKLEKITDKMAEQQIVSKETFEKYMELQKLFQEMDISELRKAMQELHQNINQMSKEDLKKHLENLTFSEEQFKKNLERTIDLFKRLQVEQKLDELIKRTEELSKTQKDIQNELNQNSTPEENNTLAQKQLDMANKEQEIQKQASELQKKMQDFENMPTDKLTDIMEEHKKQNTNKKMMQCASMIKSGNKTKAKESQDDISKDLDDLSKNLNSLKQEMLKQQSKYIINQMRKTIYNLLELSQDEEDLKNQMQNLLPNSPELQDNAQNQQRIIKDLENVIKNISEISKESFLITPQMAKYLGEAIEKMNSAIKSIEERNQYIAAELQEKSMEALNNSVIQAQKTLQMMMQAGDNSAGSLMQQLQMMAGMQMSINTQTKSLEGKNSQQIMEEAKRLAQSQRAIQKSLEQLNKEAQSSGKNKSVLGDLQKIAEEMNEVIKNLEQNNVNPETLNKQERILSRLLDASKSTQERDYEKKRKSETGKNIYRNSPQSLNPKILDYKETMYEEIIKAEKQGYSKDYIELIKKYFEQLEKSKISN